MDILPKHEIVMKTAKDEDKEENAAAEGKENRIPQIVDSLRLPLLHCQLDPHPGCRLCPGKFILP